MILFTALYTGVAVYLYTLHRVTGAEAWLTGAKTFGFAALVTLCL